VYVLVDAEEAEGHWLHFEPKVGCLYWPFPFLFPPHNVSASNRASPFSGSPVYMGSRNEVWKSSYLAFYCW